MTSEERQEARYQRRKAKRQRNRQARSDAVGTLDEVFSFHNMFWAGKKCCNGVRWKQSTQNFELHLFSGTAKRRRQILDGTWKPAKTVHFTLRERGKVRPIDAPHINDRQIHKVLSERVLIPLYGPGMIYDNGASQKGKGLQFHYKRLKKHLRSLYRRYGTAAGLALADYHGFFPNANREMILERHRRLILDPRIREIADKVVNSAPGAIGMPLGVEPSQMEMVALPSTIDNYMACQTKAEGTGHYMDDYHFGAENCDTAREILGTFIKLSEAERLEVNPEKCKVATIGQPFRFCKAKFQVLPSGRIITHGSRDGMKRARRKMRYFKRQVDAGTKTVRDVELWLAGQVAYYEKFDDHGRVLHLNRIFYAMFVRSENNVQNHQGRGHRGNDRGPQLHQADGKRVPGPVPGGGGAGGGPHGGAL